LFFKAFVFRRPEGDNLADVDQIVRDDALIQLWFLKTSSAFELLDL